MYYLIKFNDTEYTIPKDNLKLFAMTLGLHSYTTDECIKLLKQKGIDVLDIDRTNKGD